MENEGKMDYYSYDIINFPPPLSYSCFGQFCKENKSCSFVLDLDRKYLQHACTLTSISGRRHTMEFQVHGESIGEKLLFCYSDLLMKNSSISFLTNSSPSYLEFYFKELKLFLNAYAFYEIIVGASRDVHWVWSGLD
ncbi:hypothetical protein M9H77_23261 [Catharanthus roseus]|uniref:Uncharacterized protein n=1 Tax=Catharanthus roseus TaxID=4058 RepID=A0ACC0AWW4_CATRO|nr:hypothetical protein M9H77_23261 [Catharanthus roseus]